MTTDRPYRLALPLADATAELRAHHGTQFDPRVVDLLLELVSEDVEAVESPPPERANSHLAA
jgi:HD-GYP domain-containing protein (c-di-GMP phosphodiesterase class II)